jgi:catechol 2,3-dioxygenase-like lactoylglutathione lyase family enzyme
MTITPITSVNVKQAVPFFGVTNMEASLRFYVDGLGFKMKHSWIPDRAEDTDGRIRWCWLQLGDAAIMLQKFLPEHVRAKHLGLEHRSAFSAKMRWRFIASSNHAEFRCENVHLSETASG